MKLRNDAAASLETFRREEDSLRRLLETAAEEGRRLVVERAAAETARDEALVAGRGAGGEAHELRQRLKRELEEKDAFVRETEVELSSKVTMNVCSEAVRDNRRGVGAARCS